MFQSLNDDKPDAAEKQDLLRERGLIIAGILGLGAVVFLLVRFTIA